MILVQERPLCSVSLSLWDEADQGRWFMQLLVCISSPRELLMVATSDFVLPFRHGMADASEISNRRAPGKDAMAVASLTEVKIPA